MKEIIAKVVGGVFIAGVGHFFGENMAIAVIGGWVFSLSISKR